MRAELDGLRGEVARVAALRDDVAALGSLRQEIGQLGELRADMGRLRQELTEQLSSELLVERIVMRTQASRPGADLTDAPSRAVDAATHWTDGAPRRERTGGWPAVRLDGADHIRQSGQVPVGGPDRPPVPQLSVPPVPRPVPSPSRPPGWAPGPERTRGGATPATAPRGTLTTPSGETPAVDPSGGLRRQERWSPSSGDRLMTPGPDPAEDTPRCSATANGAARSSRHDAAPPVSPTTSLPIPGAGSRPAAVPRAAAWPAGQPAADAEPTSFRPELPPRRRRGDEPPAGPADPPAAATTQRPAVRPHPSIRLDDRVDDRGAVPEEPAGPPRSQEKRLADILAENGVSLGTGGRRRRRYRDEDEQDDVLARVLGTP